MPSLGELVRESWGPAPTPAGMPGEGVYEVEFRNKRTNVIRLLPNGHQERRLRRLADATAKLWNEVNYERRSSSFNSIELTLNQHGTNTTRSTRVCLVLMLKP